MNSLIAGILLMVGGFLGTGTESYFVMFAGTFLALDGAFEVF